MVIIQGAGGGAPNIENESDFLEVLRAALRATVSHIKVPAFPESHVLRALIQKHTKCPSFTCGLIMTT